MPHRTNPQYGANMVDRYIGSAFDVVYAVYKQLGNLPIFLEFVNETAPGIEKEFADINDRLEALLFVGYSNERMDAPQNGQMMWDRTLKKPIWWDQDDEVWRDATGTEV